MKKIKFISICLIIVTVYNIVFPCLSHARALNSSEEINNEFEQRIIKEGERIRSELVTQGFSEQNGYKKQEIDAAICSYLMQKKEEIAQEVAKEISDEKLKEEFLSESGRLGTIYVNTRYGQVVTQNIFFQAFSLVLDGAIGVWTYKVRLLWVILPAQILELIGTAIASIGTANTDNTEEDIAFLTLDSIFFNKVALLDINIFDFENAGPSTLSEENHIYIIRKNVAEWYYALRNLAIVFGLLSLIYIGVKMAISSLAEDKAKYKVMIKDWLVSIVLIFTLHYIIIFTISLNNGIVNILEESRQTVFLDLEQRREEEIKENGVLGAVFNLVSKGIDLIGGERSLQGKLAEESLNISFVRGFGASLMYCIIIIMTFAFLIQYIKRMAVICFLVLISPLITITYSIDKSRKWKSRGTKYMVERIFCKCTNTTISLYYLHAIYAKCDVWSI